MSLRLAIICFLALLSLAGPAAARSYASAVGHWEGHYSCTEGKTWMSLDIREVYDDTHVQAVFSFGGYHDEVGDHQRTEGRFAMKGTYVSGRLALAGDHWIAKPDGYDMVGLTGFIMDDGAYIRGSIEDSRCGEFFVKRM